MVTQAELRERYEYRNGCFYKKKASGGMPVGAKVGNLDKEGDAAQAYNFAADKIQKEFACLNDSGSYEIL